MERDGWILMQSVSPNEAAIWLADKRAAIDDTEFCAIYLAYDAAFDWSPGDRACTPWLTARNGGSPIGTAAWTAQRSQP
jgi:hypothetical protein